MRPRKILLCSLVAFACGGGPVPPIPSTTSLADAGNRADGGSPDATTADAGTTSEAAPTDLGGEGGTDPNQNGSPSQYCCASGAYYVCATDAAFKKCSSFDLAACFAACAPSDTACVRACTQGALHAKTDPSDCTRDPSQDGVCPAVSSSPDPTSSNSSSSSSSSGANDSLQPLPLQTNPCGGQFLGTDCDEGMQCPAGGHCTQGKCYPADVGNPCTYLNDCGSGNHCTSGCCSNGASGSACNAGFDCTSGTCTSGTCQ
jgi:hypothetical protein